MNAIPRRVLVTGIRYRILALPLILIALAAGFFAWRASRSAYPCDPPPSGCTCGGTGGSCTYDGQCGGTYNCATDATYGCNAGAGNCSCGGTICKRSSKPCTGTKTCAQLFACTRCGTVGTCEAHNPPCGPFCSNYTGGRACNPATQTCCGGCYGRSSGYTMGACECGNAGGNPPDPLHCDTAGHCSYAADCNCPPAATQCGCDEECQRCKDDPGKCMHCRVYTTGSCSNNSANCCNRWLNKPL